MTIKSSPANRQSQSAASAPLALTEAEIASEYSAMTASGQELYDIAFGMPDDPGTPLTLDEINRELTARRTGAMAHG